MSFQAYIDAVEKKSGKTPSDLLEEARGLDFGPQSKSSEIVEWLQKDYGVGRGHAMAFVHVVTNGATISDKHVRTTGVHRDESNQLRLDGIANR